METQQVIRRQDEPISITPYMQAFYGHDTQAAFNSANASDFCNGKIISYKEYLAALIDQTESRRVNEVFSKGITTNSIEMVCKRGDQRLYIVQHGDNVLTHAALNNQLKLMKMENNSYGIFKIPDITMILQGIVPKNRVPIFSEEMLMNWQKEMPNEYVVVLDYDSNIQKKIDENNPMLIAKAGTKKILKDIFNYCVQAAGRKSAFGSEDEIAKSIPDTIFKHVMQKPNHRFAPEGENVDFCTAKAAFITDGFYMSTLAPTYVIVKK